ELASSAARGCGTRPAWTGEAWGADAPSVAGPSVPGALSPMGETVPFAALAGIRPRETDRLYNELRRRRCPVKDGPAGVQRLASPELAPPKAVPPRLGPA